MLRKVVIVLMGLLMASSFQAYSEEVSLETGLEQLSYAAGYQLGRSFKRQKLSPILELVMIGLEEARTNTHPRIPRGEMRVILADPRKFLIEFAEKQKVLAHKAGAAFLQSNAKEDGVVVLPSGLQYKILTAGPEGKAPKPEDRVLVNYQGSTITGQVFDGTNATDGPTNLQVGDLVPGLAEGLQMMTPGSKWEFVIPHTLAFGDKDGPLAGQTLVYEVELLKVW